MSINNALLLVAHGSRRQASNDEVRELSEKLTATLQDRFDSNICAFLELAEPSIPAGIEQAVNNGASNIVVLPYFLSAGRHVSEDIPAILEEARQRHPEINICLAPYLGMAEQLTGVLSEIARSADLD